MAKKHQKRRVKQKKRLVQAKTKGDAKDLLKEAAKAMRRGATQPVIVLAMRAHSCATDPAEREAARAYAIEAHVRAGARAAGEARLEQFEAALALDPASPRLRFYRGLSLWQLGRLHEALDDLDAAHDKPEARYYAALGRLALTGQAASGDGSGAERVASEAERNTLELVVAFFENRLPGEVPTPLLGGARVEELWRALHAMARDPEAAPVGELAAAAKASQMKAVTCLAQYYLGVAALRRGDRATAEHAWEAAQKAGPSPAKLADNLAALRRERALQLVASGEYGALADGPVTADDRIQLEARATALEHQGHCAAQEGDWRLAAHYWRQAHGLRPRRQLAQNLALADEALERWFTAGEAWRELLRRRPRKRDHPDYLSASQVAAVWRRAGECYQRAEAMDEAVHCLRQAVKYADGDVELRYELAEALEDNGQLEAAANELQRLLARDPDHREALIHLAAIYERDWRADAIPLWRRALALEPDDGELRDQLAYAYLRRLRPATPRFVRGIIEQGLADVPEHPALLIALACVEGAGSNSKAGELLHRAYRAVEDKLGLIRAILRELARLDLQDLFQEIVADCRQRTDIDPPFWLDAGVDILRSGADNGFLLARSLLDDGVDLAERMEQQAGAGKENRFTKASAIAAGFEAAMLSEEADLAEYYRQRALREVPSSGAIEFIAACNYFYGDEDDPSEAQAAMGLLDEAEDRARAAGDEGILGAVEAFRDELDQSSRMPLGAAELFARMWSEGAL